MTEIPGVELIQQSFSFCIHLLTTYKVGIYFCRQVLVLLRSNTFKYIKYLIYSLLITRAYRKLVLIVRTTVMTSGLLHDNISNAQQCSQICSKSARIRRNGPCNNNINLILVSNIKTVQTKYIVPSARNLKHNYSVYSTKMFLLRSVISVSLLICALTQNIINNKKDVIGFPESEENPDLINKDVSIQ